MSKRKRRKNRDSPNATGERSSYSHPVEERDFTEAVRRYEDTYPRRRRKDIERGVQERVEGKRK